MSTKKIKYNDAQTIARSMALKAFEHIINPIE